MMERHQAGQEDKLVKINMDPQSGASPPGRCPFCHTRALWLAMAVVALCLASVGLIFYFLKFAPSCQQEDAQRSHIMHKLTGSEEKGRYDVFTPETAGVYLIYGWLNLTNIMTEDVILKNTFNGDSRELEKKKAKGEVFFFQKVKLVEHSRISIYFNAFCSDSLFHIHKV